MISKSYKNFSNFPLRETSHIDFVPEKHHMFVWGGEVLQL